MSTKGISAMGAIACLFIQVAGAQAFDLEGAWITNLKSCSKVFEKRGNRTVLTKKADLYGGGFVVDRNQIRGKTLTCTIKTRKEDGAVHHLLATCSSDIALQNFQFSYKPVNEDQIMRMYAGLPELDTAYHRCPRQ